MKPSLVALTALTSLVILGSGAHADQLRLSSLAQGVSSSTANESAVAGMGAVTWVVAGQLGVQLMGSTAYAGRPDAVVPHMASATESASWRHRVITGAGAGAQWWMKGDRVRPYLRGGLMRVVEQPLTNYADDPLGAMLGTRDNSNHRYGLVAGAGIDVGLARNEKLELFFSLDVSTTMFNESSQGPARYTAVGAGLGLAFDVGRVLPYRRR